MKKIVLALIILLSFILRFYQLDSYPAFNADEAALGYNAYSLLQTGKDEHGNSWPIHFQSFNDYKPGLYVYLVMPLVAILGLSEWAVRIPGALFGVLTVLLVYYLVSELFSKKIRSFQFADNDLLPLLSSFLLAISPWHIHFSRGGWEVNTATFFIVCALLFFLKGIKNNKYLFVSCIFFVLSLYTYHAARIVVPLLGLVLIYLYGKELWNKKGSVGLSGILGILLLLPLLFDLLGPAGISRAAGVGLFADPGPLNRINELRGHHTDFQSESAVMFHNKAVNYGIAFAMNWAKHYDGEFLFLSGDIIERNRVPETGQTHMLFILFFAVGIYTIARFVSWKEFLHLEKLHDDSQTRPLSFIFLWFLIAPIAASLTFQSPHALRAQNMVIPFEIINALGLTTMIGWSYAFVKNKVGKVALLGIFSFVVLWSFVRYQHMYWVHMAKEYPYSSQYGLKELVSYIDSRDEEFEQVLVTDRYDQPYIMFLFYTKYDPAKFQSEHSLSAKDQYGFSTVRNFGKYHFWPIDFTTARSDYRNSLIAGTDGEIPKEANIVKEIYGTNGYKYFEVVAN